MEELAGLYAMLANQGTLQPLRTEPSSPREEGVRLLSPEASFITLDMLRRNPRPDDDGMLSGGRAGRSPGKRARHGDSATPGPPASSVRTCWSYGSAISMDRAIPRSSASMPPRRCSSASPTR